MSIFDLMHPCMCSSDCLDMPGDNGLGKTCPVVGMSVRWSWGSSLDILAAECPGLVKHMDDAEETEMVDLLRMQMKESETVAAAGNIEQLENGVAEMEANSCKAVVAVPMWG